MINKRARSRRGRTHHLFRRMQKANCAKCGVGIRVPFIPEGKKPLYCEKCKEKMRLEYKKKRGMIRTEKEYRY
jgi:CxxC-x17-CxxC domain-containing protein